MIHEELKLRVTVDTGPAIEEIKRLQAMIEGDKTLSGRVELVLYVDTEGASARIRSMAVALTAANQQIRRLEERLGLLQERVAKTARKAPKRPLPQEL